MDENKDQNQFNSSEEYEGKREDVKKEFRGFLASTRIFLVDMLDIRTETDQQATKEAIIKDISFKGHTIWILVCSIFICSIGLNANSTAVVIGAMLISPLMGPILGIGLAFATNDIDTLRRALKNGLIMVIYSVLTAYLFFKFFPLHNESSELLARTAPDIRDVLIAFFGGLALVIARAKKGTVASVIFGVAIATALMPPLCTVGFGLAIQNYDYAIGAMYLFTINAIFIAAATYIIIKVLKIPMVRYAKSTIHRRFARIASLVALIVMIPAMITFYNVFQESRYLSQAQDFLSETIDVYQFEGNGYYLDNLTQITYHKDNTSEIELICVGESVIPDNVIDTWNLQLSKFSRLGNTRLKIVQGGKGDAQQRFDYVNELYESKKTEIANKDERIRVLEEEVSNLNRRVGRQIPFRTISTEARANYENLESIGFSHKIRTNFQKLDTIAVFEVQWKKGTSKRRRRTETEKMHEWLKIRLGDNRVQIRDITN